MLQKHAQNFSKSTRRLVFDVLQTHVGEFLSVKEILNDLEKNHAVSMKKHTVVKAIDDFKYYKIKIEERYERRGKKRVPVKVFSLTKNIYRCLE